MIEPSLPGAESPPPAVPSPRPDGNAPTVIAPESVEPPSAPEPATTDAGRPFGRYRLLAELGRGGMGVVWKAWDSQLSRVVALKQIRPGHEDDLDQVERFQREARLAAKLTHPGIVRVLDVGEHDGQRYLTTEFIEAVSLDRVMANPVPLTQAIAWVKAIAEALDYAHAQGVLHRDVKPGNVLIDALQRPHVVDFGLAKEVPTGTSTGGRAERLTLSGVLLGTPAYLSPEQAQGEVSTIRPAADQFSLGVVLYELITGEMPFSGQGIHELLSAIVESDPVPPSRWRKTIHPDLEAICLKALEKDPSRRYATMGDLARDLQRYLDGEPTVARPISFFTRIVRKAAKRRSVVVPIAAISILALGATWGVWRWRGGAVTRADDARDAAETAKATAERLLAKGRLVSRVLFRWNAIDSEVAALERAHFDSHATAEASRSAAEGPWKAVEAFARETPDDPASRATARALEGWARFLAGHEDEAIAWMREAETIDADVPYGHLMEALVLLWEVYDRAPISRIDGQAGAEPASAVQETPEVRALRSRLDELVAKVRSAAVWGQEGAEGFSDALSAVRHLCARRYSEAEAQLTKALGAVEIRSFDTVLRLFRSEARYLASRPVEAKEDLDAVLRAWPEYGIAWSERGLARIAIAEQATSRGEDPRPTLKEAAGDLDEAIAKMPAGSVACLNRGALRLMLAATEVGRGGDVEGPLKDAVEDYSAVLAKWPDFEDAREGRAIARSRLGAERLYRGADPSADYLAALEDLGKLQAVETLSASRLQLRAMCECGLGQVASMAGKDPSEMYRQALADYDAAVSGLPRHAAVRAERGYLHLLIAQGDLAAGKNPDGGYGLAMSDFEAALAIDARDVGSRRNHGISLFLLGVRDASRGEDPREHLRAAIEDFDSVLAQAPGLGDAWFYRGRVRVRLAAAEGARGGDPREGYAKGLEDLEKAVGMQPSNREAWHELVRARTDLARAEAAKGGSPDAGFARAVEDANRGLAADPANWRVRAERGTVFEMLQKPAEAVADYEEVARILGGTPAWLEPLLARARAKLPQK